MTDDFDAQLQTLFDKASGDLSAETFVARVSIGLRAQRRRRSALRAGATVTTLVILGMLTPDVVRGVASLAGMPDAAVRIANRSLHVVSGSSILQALYLYGGVFAAYLLARIVRGSSIRWA